MSNDTDIPAGINVEKIRSALTWCSRATRRAMQQCGINVIPSNFYSQIPSIDQIEESFEYKEDAPYVATGIFDETMLTEYLASLVEFSRDFNPPVDDDEKNPKGFFWKNSQFSYSDGMSYYAMLRKLKPRKIVGIGSGFSTLAAIEANRENNAKIVCYEPFPREFLETLPVDLRRKKAQDITIDELNAELEPGAVLFIDSTHVVCTGSDVVHILLRLLPSVKHDIHVHFHDIFLPFGLPKAWLLDHQIFWVEQYLLAGFLVGNPRAQVVYGSAYNQHLYPELMRSFMHDRYPAGGGSLWFRYAAKAPGLA